MNHGRYGDDKYSRDLGRLKSKYLPASKEEAYFDNFDQIEWKANDSDFVPGTNVRIIKGKARKNSACENLFIKESVNAARTPVLERKGLAGEDTFKHLN